MRPQFESSQQQPADTSITGVNNPSLMRPTSLHMPFPDMKHHRHLERYEVLGEEGITVDLDLDNNAVLAGLAVINLSAGGISVFVPEQEAFCSQLTHGKRISLQLKLGHGYRNYQLSGAVRHIHKSSKPGLMRLGIETFAPIQDTEDNLKICHIPDQSQLVGYVYKEYQFQEKASIKIVSIAESYFVFETTDPLFLAFPGMNLSVHLSLAQEKGESFECMVLHIQEIRKSSILVKAKIKHYRGVTKDWLATFLFQHARFSPAQLRNIGLTIKNVSDALRVRTIQSNDEYLQVLELRRSAYAKAGKLAQGAGVEETVNPHDPTSTILVAIHGDRIVGSITLTLPQSEDVMLESEAYFKEGYPASFPKKCNMVEISRLCVDSAYQGTDILIRLLSHICRIGMLSKRTHLVTSADDNLWPLYEKMGFYKTGLSYRHQQLAGKVHHLILYSRERFIAGTGTGPLIWNKIYGKMHAYLRINGIIRERMPLRIRLYRFIGFCLAPVERPLEKYLLRSGKRRHGGKGK